jgi:hypothetical protein
VFNFPGYKRDENQNYTKISYHPCSRAIITTNAGDDVVKQEPLYTAGGNAN